MRAERWPQGRQAPVAAPARRPVQRPVSATRAAGYLRVSTTKQGDGFSPELQEEAITTYAADHGLDLVLVERDFESGHHNERPGYQRLLGMIRSGDVGTIIVHQLDRLGETTAELIVRLDEMEKLGVKLISVKEGKQEPGILFDVLGSMAKEYSRQRTGRRVRTGIGDDRARQGVHHGVVPTGYKLVYPERIGSGRYQSGVLTPDEPAPFVRELFQKYADGMSQRDLARWANEPGHPAAPKSAAWSRGHPGAPVAQPHLSWRSRVQQAG